LYTVLNTFHHKENVDLYIIMLFNFSIQYYSVACILLRHLLFIWNITRQNYQQQKTHNNKTMTLHQKWVQIPDLLNYKLLNPL